MNDELKTQVKKARELGFSYRAIARATTLPVGTVKAFCSFNDIHPQGELQSRKANLALRSCQYCGKLFSSNNMDAKYCSAGCRNKEWREQQCQERWLEESSRDTQIVLEASINESYSSVGDLNPCRRK